MEALNRAIGDADMFRKMLDKIDAPAAPATRNISAEVEAWNERVEREKYEKERAKMARRMDEERKSVAERLR